LPAHVIAGTKANSQLTVGLIGCGGRGAFDAGLAQADGRARVTALCDLFDDAFERAKATIGIDKPKLYRDFEKLLASPVDVVIIATPAFEHARMLVAAIQAGKHVYCEKPAATDLAGCEKVIAAGRRAPKQSCIVVGYQQRYSPGYREAFRRVESGGIGKLVSARGWWMSMNGLGEDDWWKRYPSSDAATRKLRHWYAFKDLSGDILIEQDSHIIDSLHWFLQGLPVQAVGRGGRRVRTWVEILDHLSVLYEFPDGLIVTMEANQMSPAGYRRVGEEFTGVDGVIATTRSGFVQTRGPRQVESVDTRYDITKDAMREFLDRIISRQPENVAERSALTSLIAVLGTRAVYSRKETTWKGEFGSLGL